jgi:hypothetical protein
VARGEEALDRALAEMWCFVAEAFCWFLNSDVELDDDVDTAVLLDYINCTGIHVSNVLKALWGPMLQPERRASAVATLCELGVPDFMCVCATDRQHIAELAVEAGVRATDVYITVRRTGRAEVLDELEFTLDHLDTIVFLTDPVRLEAGPRADAEERTAMADVREACRQDVEEARALVRAQLQAASN